MREKIGILRKVDNVGRVVIPIEIRRLLGIEIGDNVSVSYVKITNEEKKKEYVVEVRKA